MPWAASSPRAWRRWGRRRCCSTSGAWAAPSRPPRPSAAPCKVRHGIGASKRTWPWPSRAPPPSCWPAPVKVSSSFPREVKRRRFGLCLWTPSTSRRTSSISSAAGACAASATSRSSLPKASPSAWVPKARAFCASPAARTCGPWCPLHPSRRSRPGSSWTGRWTASSPVLPARAGPGDPPCLAPRTRAQGRFGHPRAHPRQRPSRPSHPSPRRPLGRRAYLAHAPAPRSRSPPPRRRRHRPCHPRRAHPRPRGAVLAL